MITTRIEMVEKKITIYKCDFCNNFSEGNQGCCGVRPIQSCQMCKKDICHTHRHWYSEDDWGDRPYGLYVCDDCKPDADKAWEWALEYAGRHDDIIEKMMEWYKENKNENNI